MAAGEGPARTVKNPPIPDEVLVARVLAGEEPAFEILYERYFRRVFLFVNKRLRNRSDTEETVQEVFFSAFASIASYRGEAPFAAWLLGITRRSIANRFKKQRPTTVPLEPEEASAGLDPVRVTHQREPTPLEAYECQERIERLRAASEAELSSEQRQLFELHHLKHHSIADIAAAVQKSEDAVKASLYRTRKLLLAR